MKGKKHLLNSKTPHEFIDRSLKVDITSGKKAAIAREWFELTGYTNEDLKYARHRHPYWKAKKMEGHEKRNVERWSKYNFSKGKKIKWEDEDYARYLKTDVMSKDGKYKQPDKELAEEFKTTIPAIQHLRRKRNLCIEILNYLELTKTEKKTIELMKSGENKLRDIRNNLMYDKNYHSYKEILDRINTIER